MSDWNIFLDPGHSRTENMGIYNYSEAQKVLRVALYLRDLLLERTDIDTVYMIRTNDQQQVSLTQRTDYANNVGAAWYHSIHSDAGDPNVNSTLLMYGGWRENGFTVEKIPNGGRYMSNIITDILTRGMRISTRGNYADRTFYQGFPENHDNKYPYLHVNRESNMPSELSEAGFHTNPLQNQLNMNTNWKRLEAYTLYWSILEFFDIDRPSAGIAAGIISDIESNLPINGAVISINGQIDTTDTYESLFKLYSNDPEQLKNGFYFIENLPPGTYPIQVQAENFDLYSSDISIEDTFFTFKDIQLISNVPPFLNLISFEENDSLYPGEENIGIIFSRPMNKASVESTLAFSPPADVNFIWSDGDRRVALTTAGFSFNTDYRLTISGNSSDKYDHPFDGNGDGEGGDDFILNFKTKIEDLLPPVIVKIYPDENAAGTELNPVISLSFNEQINESFLDGKIKLIKDSDQSDITGIVKHYIVNRRSVINFFVSDQLDVNESYTIFLEPGLEDDSGNEITAQFSQSFNTGNHQFTIIDGIDNFENGIGNWWSPEQSGSTEGIIPELTANTASSDYYNYTAGGSSSMKLTYGWDTLSSNLLIREYYSPAIPGFNSSNILQVYIFGDGLGNKFRFAVREVNGSSPTNLEVSPWYIINWIGWKLVTWNMTSDGTGTWLGNGILENPLRFDSFQLTYKPGSKTTGELYFDDLIIVNETAVGINYIQKGIPAEYSLEQNYPNPFNPYTRIKFGIPRSGNVKLEVYNLLGEKIVTLADKEMTAGLYQIYLNAEDFSAGVYIYILSVNDFSKSRKMILLK
jgi:N-acetylmuramoyl-L-alanine amidase